MGGSGRIEVLKRCLQALPFSLPAVFRLFAISLFARSFFFRSTESPAKTSCKQTTLTTTLTAYCISAFTFLRHARSTVYIQILLIANCFFNFRIIPRTIHCLVNNAVHCWTACFPLWLPDLRFRREYSVSIKCLDQFRFLGNLPPTLPLSQHFALSEK